MTNSDSQPEIEYLFVYGTLRTDISRPVNSDLLGETTDRVEKATMQAALYDIGEYPGLILSADPSDRVIGEVFHIKPGQTKRLLDQLDRYEGMSSANDVRGQYRREIREVNCNDGRLSAWVYVYNWPIENLVRIDSGDYLQYLRSKYRDQFTHNL